MLILHDFFLRLKRSFNFDLDPNGMLFDVARCAGYCLFNSGVLKPNMALKFIHSDDATLVLVPLSGSSSIRVPNSERVTRKFERKRTLYVLWRGNDERMQSCYNKKIRNPSELFKAIQLGSFGGLKPNSSVDEFIDHIERGLDSTNKEKHFLLNEEILQILKIRDDDFIKVSIRDDRDLLQEVFDLKFDGIRNSSAEKSVFQDVVTFSPEQRARILGLEAGLKQPDHDGRSHDK